MISTYAKIKILRTLIQQITYTVYLKYSYNTYMITAHASKLLANDVASVYIRIIVIKHTYIHTQGI